MPCRFKTLRLALLIAAGVGAWAGFPGRINNRCGMPVYLLVTGASGVCAQSDGTYALAAGSGAADALALVQGVGLVLPSDSFLIVGSSTSKAQGSAAFAVYDTDGKGGKGPHDLLAGGVIRYEIPSAKLSGMVPKESKVWGDLFRKKSEPSLVLQEEIGVHDELAIAPRGSPRFVSPRP